MRNMNHSCLNTYSYCHTFLLHMRLHHRTLPQTRFRTKPFLFKCPDREQLSMWLKKLLGATEFRCVSDG
jgi:hypothetical protein